MAVRPFPVSGPDDELPAYTERPGPSRPAIQTKRPSRPKRVWLGLAVAVALWAGVAALTDKPHNPVPNRGEPSSSYPALGSSLHTNSGEYVWADQPTTDSYRPTFGIRYDAVRGIVPVDVTITRIQAGDYTIDFANLAAPGGTVKVSAYGGPSTCYSLEQEAIGPDEFVRVVCMYIKVSVPSNHVGPLTGGGSDSRFIVTFLAPASPLGRAAEIT